MNKAIFLDRDGTINYDPGYLGDAEKVKLYPGVADGIKLLKDKYNFKVIVISNQSGISRGLITHEQVQAVNNKINELLYLESETVIDEFFYCPFHPEFDEPKKCECRKPSPQMIFKAADKFSIDLKKSFFLGDRESDIICSKNAGTYSILLSTTMSNEEIYKLKNSQNSPNFITYNFFDAVKHIEGKILGETFEV